MYELLKSITSSDSIPNTGNLSMVHAYNFIDFNLGNLAKPKLSISVKLECSITILYKFGKLKSGNISTTPHHENSKLCNESNFDV